MQCSRAHLHGSICVRQQRHDSQNAHELVGLPEILVSCFATVRDEGRVLSPEYIVFILFCSLRLRAERPSKPLKVIAESHSG